MNTPEHRFTLPELIDLMHKHRLTHIKLGSMELEMSPSAFTPDVTVENKDPLAKAPVPADFLVWSLADSALDSDAPEAS